MDKTRLFEPAETPDGVHALTREALAGRVAQLAAGRLEGVHIPVAVPLFRRLDAGGHYHSHPELFLQLSGVSRMRLATGLLNVRCGELLLMPRGVAHAETADSATGPFCNLVFMHTPGHLHYHAGLPLASQERKLSGIRVAGSCAATHPYGSRLYGYLNEAADLATAGHPVHHPAIHGLLLAHLALMQTILDEAGASPRNRESALVAHARRLVREQLANPTLCVRFLAEQLGCTPDYLSARFHRETELRLAAHINRERCHMARHLLRTTAWNVAEVAEACGYADPAYFSRVFTRQEGVHPRAFRHRE